VPPCMFDPLWFVLTEKFSFVETNRHRKSVGAMSLTISSTALESSIGMKLSWVASIGIIAYDGNKQGAWALESWYESSDVTLSLYKLYKRSNINHKEKRVIVTIATIASVKLIYSYL